MTSKTMRVVSSVALAALMALITCFATDVQATALYSASASNSIRIVDIESDVSGQLGTRPSDLTILFGSFDFFGVFDPEPTYEDEYTDSEGAASANASATATAVAPDPTALLDIGDGFDLLATASGTAISPPLSWAESEATAEGFMYFENQSQTETYTISFEVSYDYSVSAAVDDPYYELATASIDIFAEDYYGIMYDIYDYSDTDCCGGSYSDTQTLTFSMVLDPGFENGLYVGAWANDVWFLEGFAGSAPSDPVPEPATMLLLGSGLIGLAGAGRKKFKK